MDFFKQFNVVLNGLDNLDARRHVNRICLAADVPLVESGTTGFLGQVNFSFYISKVAIIHFLLKLVCRSAVLYWPLFVYMFSLLVILFV